MASRKSYKFAYRLKLFLPITMIIWIIIAVMVIFSSENERNYRYNNVQAELQLMNLRIIDMINHGYDVNRFLRFVEKYYGTQHDEYAPGELEGIRISIFQGDEDFPIRFVGDPLYRGAEEMGHETKTLFYCMVEDSIPGENIVIRTAVPHNAGQASTEVFSRGFWIFILIMGITATVLSYLTATHMARNVSLLRDFSERATADLDFIPNTSFTNDDLGEIGRRIIDIYNERKEAQDAHEREHLIALKASEEQARLKRQIANNVNHELKTPVGIIRGYIDTMVANPNMDESQREHFLSKTQKQVERLVDMLDDLSTLTRLDDASGSIPTREVNMNALLENLDEEIYESGIGGDLTFVYELPDNCIVKGSESLINAAILNLVKNAAAYSHGSEMGLIGEDLNENFYSFNFYDNGTGLDDEHLPKLFDRFYRVEHGRSRKTGGTGLGLSIVKSTIVSMGGSISVRNRDTGGLEFLFTLPKWKSQN